MDFDAIFQKIKNILTESVIPEHDCVFDIMNRASEVLENEITDYRPENSSGAPGSLLDFQSDSLPLIVVPDLHARPFFLLNILEYQIDQLEKISVFDALSQNKIRILFVGDILHTEKNKKRWNEAQIEFNQNIFTGPAMSLEMQEGLSLLCGLYELKTAFPKNVHILKGNHENVLNQTGGGDFCFKKYACEGYMSKVFLQEYYGDDIVYIIHCVEKALPLVFVERNCVVSHAEPEKFYSKEEIVNAKSFDHVIEGLTWTGNDKAEKGSVGFIINQLRSEKSLSENDYVYIAGHRPVLEKFNLRQNGKLVQIHNPSMQNVALIFPDKKFNPKKDIVEVQK